MRTPTHPIFLGPGWMMPETQPIMDEQLGSRNPARCQITYAQTSLSNLDRNGGERTPSEQPPEFCPLPYPFSVNASRANQTRQQTNNHTSSNKTQYHHHTTERNVTQRAKVTPSHMSAQPCGRRGGEHAAGEKQTETLSHRANTPVHVWQRGLLRS